MISSPVQSRGKMLQNERDDGENDEDHHDPFRNIHTETSNTSHPENSSDECQYQKENCQFDESSATQLQRGNKTEATPSAAA